MQVCEYSNTTCGDILEMKDKGYLHTSIKNTGSLDADFYISVSSPPMLHVLMLFGPTNAKQSFPQHIKKPTNTAICASRLVNLESSPIRAKTPMETYTNYN